MATRPASTVDDWETVSGGTVGDWETVTPSPKKAAAPAVGLPPPGKPPAAPVEPVFPNQIGKFAMEGAKNLSIHPSELARRPGGTY